MNWSQHEVLTRTTIQSCVCFSRLSSPAAACRSAQNCETDSFLVTGKSRWVRTGIQNIKHAHTFGTIRTVCVHKLCFSVSVCETLFQRHHTLLSLSSLPQRQSPNFSIACSKRKKTGGGNEWESQKEKPDAIGLLRVTGVIVMCQSA